MSRFNWPRVSDDAVSLIPPDHPNTLRVLGHLLDHARAGRAAFAKGHLVEAKFHRDCCSNLIWRLSVDGLTASGEIRWDGAKYETRLTGRLSSAAARKIRDSAEFSKCKQSALKNKVACDHVVPRNCVSQVLICPGSWDPDDEESGRRFVLAHAEVAIISPEENGSLDKADMPPEWWNATLADKEAAIYSRYKKAKITVTRCGN